MKLFSILSKHITIIIVMFFMVFGLNAENQAKVIESEKNEAEVNGVKESETEENTEETIAQEIGESEDIYPTD